MTGPTDGARHEEAEGLDPSRAFALLGNPIRLEIVMALHEAGREGPLAFSELYDRVAVDGTGQFDYHRDELVPHFVRKGEEGYELTAAGARVARAVAAGTYIESAELAPFGVEGDCHDCGATDLVGAYRSERFRIRCEVCDNQILNVEVPPSLVRGRTPGEFVEAFERWARDQIEQARGGLCPDCGGPIEPDVREPNRESVDVERFAAFDCTVCGRDLVTSFGGLAITHPEVSAFLAEHGRDPGERPYWTLRAVVSDSNVHVVSEDPVRVRVTITARGETCTVEFDDDLAVVEVDVTDDGSE